MASMTVLPMNELDAAALADAEHTYRNATRRYDHAVTLDVGLPQNQSWFRSVREGLEIAETRLRQLRQ